MVSYSSSKKEKVLICSQPIDLRHLKGSEVKGADEEEEGLESPVLVTVNPRRGHAKYAEKRIWLAYNYI